MKVNYSYVASKISMYGVSCNLDRKNKSCGSYLDFTNKWWSHSFLEIVYWSVWVEDLNYLFKLQKTDLVCHQKVRRQKEEIINMTYLLTFNGSFSKEFYNEERILSGHLMSCYVYDNCCDLFPEASAGCRRCRKSWIKGNTRKACDKVKNTHCGIKARDRRKQISIHHSSS